MHFHCFSIGRIVFLMVRAITAKTRASAARARSIKINRRDAKKARAAIGRAGHSGNAMGREKCMSKVHNMTRVTLGCVHQFHRRCLYRWLKYNTNCPLCRYNFISAIPPEEPEEPHQWQGD
ncbi:hypothetical protein niasHS_017236 [Heterodera schachtii]|uniref:RING-type domain-containing protein n=1 Tax=Heterodera schachtii TaxID=97005 RepID=A0ABD2HZB0_HETSC